MNYVIEIITHWYPVLFFLSAGIALAVWAWASKRKARLEIEQATNLILERRYRNGQMSKAEFERRTTT